MPELNICDECRKEFITNDPNSTYCGQCKAKLRRDAALERLQGIEQRLGVHVAVQVPEDAA